MARLLLLVAVAGLAVVGTVAHKPKHSEDDFAFDNSEDFQIDISGSIEDGKGTQTLRRLWGVPDTSAYVGRLFRLEIPKEAFSGGVTAYKVTGLNKQPLPPWLVLDSKHGILTGVAAHSDVGSHMLTVSAHGKLPGRKAEDTFTVEVRRDLEKPLIGVGGARCLAGEDELILAILLDRPFHHIKPKQKIKALMSLSSFMGIDGEAFSIDSYNLHDSPNTNYTVFLSGPGNAKKTHNEHSTAIYLNVGCSGHLWAKHKILVHQLREQARDGSVSDLIHLPMLGWRVMKKAHKPDPRLKRQAEEGSAYYDSEDDQEGDDYSGYEENDDYDSFDAEDDLPEVDPAIPLPRTTSSTAAPTTTPTIPTTILTTRTTPTILPTHPHRHHHGEPTYPNTSWEDLTDNIKNTESDIFITMETTPEIPIVKTTIVKSVEAVTATDIPVVTTPTAVNVRTTEFLTETFTAQIPIELDKYQSNNNHKPYKATVTVDIPRPTDPTTTTQRPSEDTTPFATAITTNAIVEKNQPIEIVPANETDIERTFKESRDKIVLHRNSPVQIVPEETTLAATTMQSTLLIEPSVLPSEPSTLVTPRLASVVTTTERVQLPTAPSTPLTPITTITLAPPPPPSTPPTQLVETYTEERTTTEQEAIIPVEKSSTIVGRTTETVDFASPANSPPTLNHRMKKIAVTAGKAFRYIIPEDLFTDTEDGPALSLRMYDSDKAALSADSWVQFLPRDREVYGLPLDEHVSKWEYIVEARDSKGATAVDNLDITVQQHKGRRAVNHEFSVKMKVVQKYPAAVNWQIRALEGLVNLLGDTDMDQITVREVGRDNDLVEFVWTNDTLPKSECPTKQIEQLLNIMRDDESGSPSSALSDAMAPELKARWVGWRALGVCQASPTPPPVLAVPAPPAQPDNFPPVPRNQVDNITAIVGHLLVFKVPEDTFFDPEDGSARSLHLHVVRGDRSPLPPLHWLQFDSKNQEFYGLPTDRDIGKKDYQLIAEDSGGMTANDGLIVEVNPAPAVKHNVEFSLTLGSPLATLMSSAKVKRNLLQKMRQLFYDDDASSIRVKSITDHPTTIVWYNTSLPINHCPEEEIQQLRKILVREDESLTSRVDEIMGPDFPVMSVTLTMQGICAGQGTNIGTGTSTGTSSGGGSAPNLDAPLNKNTQQTGATFGKIDDYLITFIIPAIIVVCMIIIAGIIACVLYRRRKTGKMSLGDEEERQAFRSKGIPVIFQDELDEKPDPSNKSPVIMKEEKPPLLPPPSYGGSDSPAPSPRAPYHPPPPFPPNRESARNSRAKATPTYRKPPPYVPP